VTKLRNIRTWKDKKVYVLFKDKKNLNDENEKLKKWRNSQRT